MGREIKFRGLRPYNKEWAYGYYVVNAAGMHLVYYQPFDSATSNTYHQVDPETVGEFTGLKDKNGVEIYEGDILKTDYYSGTQGDFRRLIGRVEFRSASFMVFGIKKYDGLIKELHQCSEIIGNIHQNP